MDEMVTWLRGVLDATERNCHETGNVARTMHSAELAEGAIRAVLARIEAERAILDMELDPYVVSDIDGQDPGSAREGHDAAWRDAVRWLAYGHRFDALGWRDEWRPDRG